MLTLTNECDCSCPVEYLCFIDLDLAPRTLANLKICPSFFDLDIVAVLVTPDITLLLLLDTLDIIILADVVLLLLLLLPLISSISCCCWDFFGLRGVEDEDDVDEELATAIAAADV